MFALVEAIRVVLGPNRRILSCFPTSTDLHEMIFSVDIDDDTSYTARIGCNMANDKTMSTLALVQRRYAGEAASLAFLAKIMPTIPIPKVAHLDLTTDNPLGLPFILIENPFGDEITQILPELAFEEKETLVRCIAEVSAQIYRVTLPPSIGPISGTDSRGSLVAGSPKLRAEGLPDNGRLDRTFDSLKQYLTVELKAFIHRLSQDEGPDAAHEASLLAGRILEIFPHILPSNDPSMLRTTLAYSDLKEGSIIIDEDNRLAGIVGKKATALPACMTASIPAFLRTDGIYARDDMDDMDMDDEEALSNEEIAHLQNVFVETARQIDPTYPAALIKGEKVRQLFEFVYDTDIRSLLHWEVVVREQLAASGVRP